MTRDQKKIISFDEILKALQDSTRAFPPTFLHRFSDLPREDLLKLKGVWKSVPVERRVTLLNDMEELMEVETLVSFDEFTKFALEDSQPEVRQVSLRLLWECHDRSLIPVFIQMMEEDSDSLVRAGAASALGQFVYIGELEELPQNLLHRVEEHLLKVLNGKELPIVRRRALESMGFSSRPEMIDLIQAAYNQDDPEWVSSALFAMGRSADERWIPSLLDMLDHPEHEIAFEAIRAIGELEASAGRGPLLEMLEAGIEDEELRMAVIWSLSKIGGENVREVLEAILEETEDESEAGFIEEALDNLEFVEGFEKFGMFDFGIEDDEEEMTNVIDLEDDNLADDDDPKLEK